VTGVAENLVARVPIMSTISWQNFYPNPSGFKGFMLDIIGHLYYIMSVLVRLPKSTLEVGTGTGFHSCFISYFGISVVALDINREVIEIARRNENHFGGKASFVVASASSLPFKDKVFDVCFSQGLLEHFDNKSICRFLESFLRVSYSIILSVPSDYYPCKDLGNERLLAPGGWSKLISKCKFCESKTISVNAHYYPGLNVFGKSSLSRLVGPYHTIINVYVKSSKKKNLTKKKQRDANEHF
jgi:SAM-dependent methyltransferase